MRRPVLQSKPRDRLGRSKFRCQSGVLWQPARKDQIAIGPGTRPPERRQAVVDVIYVDGSHARNDVIVDSILAWRLLRPDGLMIWDDYNMEPQLPDEER